MKTTLSVMIFMMLFASAFSSPPDETDFKERFTQFIAEKDANLIPTIWQIGEAPLSAISLEFRSQLTIAALAGISSIEFKDIEPDLIEYLKKPTVRDGKRYMLFGKPYKLIRVELNGPLKNDSFTSFEMITGLNDGKLYILGLKRMD